jgi:hypothetical protein
MSTNGQTKQAAKPLQTNGPVKTLTRLQLHLMRREAS